MRNAPDPWTTLTSISPGVHDCWPVVRNWHPGQEVCHREPNTNRCPRVG
jgi:hypothetical protein